MYLVPKILFRTHLWITNHATLLRELCSADQNPGQLIHLKHTLNITGHFCKFQYWLQYWNFRWKQKLLWPKYLWISYVHTRKFHLGPSFKLWQREERALSSRRRSWGMTKCLTNSWPLRIRRRACSVRRQRAAQTLRWYSYVGGRWQQRRQWQQRSGSRRSMATIWSAEQRELRGRKSANTLKNNHPIQSLRIRWCACSVRRQRVARPWDDICTWAGGGNGGHSGNSGIGSSMSTLWSTDQEKVSWNWKNSPCHSIIAHTVVRMLSAQTKKIETLRWYSYVGGGRSNGGHSGNTGNRRSMATLWVIREEPRSWKSVTNLKTSHLIQKLHIHRWACTVCRQRVWETLKWYWYMGERWRQQQQQMSFNGNTLEYWLEGTKNQ